MTVEDTGRGSRGESPSSVTRVSRTSSPQTRRKQNAFLLGVMSEGGEEGEEERGRILKKENKRFQSFTTLEQVNWSHSMDSPKKNSA